MERVIKKVRILMLFGYLTLILGISLLVVGNFFSSQHWNDAFYGAYTGFFVVALSFFLTFVLVLYTSFNDEAQSKSSLLSSRISLFIKYFSPYYITTVLLIVSTVTFFSKYRQDLFWPLFLFLLVLLIGILFVTKLINIVELLGDKDAKVYSSSSHHLFMNNDDYKISRNLLFSYITYKDKKLYFLNKLSFIISKLTE